MSEDLGSVRRSPRFGVNDVNCKRNNGKLTPCRSNKKLKMEGEDCKKSKAGMNLDRVSFLIGDPIPDDEARRRWPYRYQDKDQAPKPKKSEDEDDDVLVLDVKCHFSQAEVEKCVYDLGDCAYIKGEDGGENFIGRIVEFFRSTDDQDYCRVQWFYRAEDTVMKEEAEFHDKRRLFVSDLMNDNPLDCIVSKLKIIHIPSRVKLKSHYLPPFDFYFDMKYSVDYSTFCTVTSDDSADKCKLSPSGSMKIIQEKGNKPFYMEPSSHKPPKLKMALLDVYSGCGAMSAGLCLGAKLTGVNLVTRWGLDVNKSACESFQLNHPEAQIRNESAQDFLSLLKEWDKLCKRYAVNDAGSVTKSFSRVSRATQKDVKLRSKSKGQSDELEVASVVDICYGDPCDSRKRGLYFQVRWAGYGPSEDTWEPVEGLKNCQERVQDFVRRGSRAKILPRPGDVDIICGGPPCQGISGYNRHRNVTSPLDDEKNQQIVVFMDIVNFLRPKYVLMENVADILRFAKGCLGRYALSRLVHSNYQARIGIMAAGCYGLPQYRLRVFLWGAQVNERLPQFPLPTHDVVVRYGAPSEFERNVVAYDEDQSPDLENALVLKDAISDLPPVSNSETRSDMSYKQPPETEFQKFIRARRCEMEGTLDGIETEKCRLYDHHPLALSEDDYLRVCRIPQRKGANFRDLPGVVVGADNTVKRDTASEIILPSGKQLVPDYAINLREGKSLKPFARLWWDETVPTILTTPDPHIQAILHPEQDRVLTIRECARLQGFPDYYRLLGNARGRYCQIGNAVAVPVARALGYALGMAAQELTGDGHLLTLPPKFSHTTALQFFQPSPEDEKKVH